MMSRPEFSSQNLLRIQLDDLNSPLWSDPHNLSTFLANLRAFSRHINCLIMITIDSLISSTELCREFLRVSDAAFRLDFLNAAEQKAMNLHEQFDGRFFIQKLPAITSMSCARPECLDLVFNLTRKKFEVKIFHLPPAIGGSDDNNKQGIYSVCQTVQEDF